MVPVRATQRRERSAVADPKTTPGRGGSEAGQSRRRCVALEARVRILCGAAVGGERRLLQGAVQWVVVNWEDLQTFTLSIKSSVFCDFTDGDFTGIFTSFPYQALSAVRLKTPLKRSPSSIHLPFSSGAAAPQPPTNHPAEWVSP